MRIPSNRPFIVAKIAQTLDGKIASRRGDSKWITSKDARDFARRRRDRFDGICVGIDTVLADNPRLTGVRKTNLTKIIFDTRLRIPAKARLFQSGGDQKTILITSRKAPLSKINNLRARGVNVMIVAQRAGRIDISKAMRQLREFGLRKVLIEGGSTLTGSALKAGVVDQVNIYIAPKILGDEQGRSSVVGLAPTSIGGCIPLKNIKHRKIKDNFFIQADVYRNR